MEIVVSVLVLAIAIFLVVKGGDIFVSSSYLLAKKMHIPELVFGATFVSLATTFGELLISIFSSIDGTTDLAVGNAVGSAICNVALVCGIGFLFMQSTLKKGGVLKYYLLMLVTTFVAICGFFFEIYIWQAIVLLVFAVLFFVFNYMDAKTFSKTYKKEDDNEKHKPLWLLVVLFLLGAVALGGGAYLLVDKVEFLANAIGVGEQFIGLTVVAIGTSLPELTTMITSIKKKAPDLAIGNIIGANILNLSLILAVPRLIAYNQGMPISKETAFISLPFCLMLILMLTIPMLTKRKTFKWQGIIFLATYGLYIIYLILNAVFKFL